MLQSVRVGSLRAINFQWPGEESRIVDSAPLPAPLPSVHSRGKVEMDSKQPKALAGKLSAC